MNQESGYATKRRKVTSFSILVLNFKDSVLVYSLTGVIEIYLVEHIK